MKKMVVAGVLAIALLGLLSTAAFTAPGDVTKDVTVNASVAKAVWLDVTDPTVSLSGSPNIDTSTDKIAGFEVRANWNWTLQANALASLSGTEADGITPATLPGSSIQVESSAASGNVTVATGGKTNLQSVTANYAPDFQWTDTAGTYSGTHTYTLSFN